MSVTDVCISDKIVENPKYLKPREITFKVNDRPVVWESTHNHDSVYILIYNKDRSTFVLVRQFRVVVYTSLYFKSFGTNSGKLEEEKLPYDRGQSLELCAGLCDKPNTPIKTCAVEEVLEETGYSVAEDELQLITTLLSPSRIGTEYVFYVEVTDSQKTSAGGGLADEGESILVEEVPAKSFAKSVANDPESSVTSNIELKFACLWFLLNLKD